MKNISLGFDKEQRLIIDLSATGYRGGNYLTVEDFNRQYLREEQVASICGIFTSLGMVIACLVLIGLVASVAERRTVEIAIRKVLGASTAGIVSLLAAEFLYLIIAANKLAWPLSYLIMMKWLQSFACRINQGIEAFLAAGLIALCIALLSLTCQSLKAAHKNPVDSLRSE